MTSPQVENGYTRLANELIDQFCRRDFDSQEWRILWAVIRKTYGFNKREDVIPLSQFHVLTGIDSRSVTRTLKSLRLKNVLICKESRTGNTYRLNKNYKEWVVAILPLCRGKSASGESAPMVGAGSRMEVGAGSCVDSRGQSAPLNRQIDNRHGTFEVSALKNERQILKKLGWDDDKIRNNFLVAREIPEAIIDQVFDKKF